MGKCVVPGCNMHTDRDSTNGIRFFPIPAIRQTGPPGFRMRSALRRRAWLLIINNDDLKDEYEKTTRRICSRHFLSGQPAPPNDEKNSDWLPSLHVGDDTDPPSRRIKVEKPSTEPVKVHHLKIVINQPVGKVEATKASTVSASTEEAPESAVDATIQPNLLELNMDDCEEESPPPGNDMVTVRCDDYKMMEEELQLLRNENAELKKSYTRLRNQLTEAEVDKLELNAEMSELKRTSDEHVVKNRALEEEAAFLRGKVESSENSIKKLQEEARSSGCKIASLEFSLERVRRASLCLDLIKQDDDFVEFYTGLPSYNAFEVSLNHVSSRVVEPRCVLGPWQCFLLTLMRLRLSLTLQDLAYRFAISKSTACNIFERWLYHLYKSIDSFIVWPDRDTIQRTTSASFKKMFSDNVVVILHCFELYPDNSKAVDARTVTQSNAKHRNTVKYFIGITPSGAISFVSQGWEARGRELHALTDSGFYSKLIPDDEIVTDRRLPTGDLPTGDNIGWCCAKVLDSTSTSGQVKLKSQDINDTRKLTMLRIHVEKINSLRRKFRILRGEVPLQGTHKKSAHDVPQIDQIMRVCCALTNISDKFL